MNNPIILPSGNVVPALSEQDEYLRLRYASSFPTGKRRRYKAPWPRGRRKLPKWDISTSGESRFIQHGIESKTIDEKTQSRLDWRERKGFRRDKANRYHDRGLPHFIKRMCNKRHRQWERHMIHEDRSEECGTWNYKRKDLYDPWFWD